MRMELKRKPEKQTVVAFRDTYTGSVYFPSGHHIDLEGRIHKSAWCFSGKFENPSKFEPIYEGELHITITG